MLLIEFLSSTILSHGIHLTAKTISVSLLSSSRHTRKLFQLRKQIGHLLCPVERYSTKYTNNKRPPMASKLPCEQKLLYESQAMQWSNFSEKVKLKMAKCNAPYDPVTDAAEGAPP